MIGLILDLARQVRGILRPAYGGLGNARGWAQGTIIPLSNRTGGDLPLMTLVRTVTPGGARVEPTDTDAETDVLGVVVGYVDVSGLLIEADAPDGSEAAVLSSGVAAVLIDVNVDRGEYAFAAATAGQARPDATIGAGAFGQFVAGGGAGQFALVRVGLPGGGSSGGGGAPDTADYLVGTSQAGLSAEIVVGTTPNGELGGTWGAITVDGTHSGSSHASIAATAASDLAAHEADALDAHDGSAVSVSDAGGYYTGNDVETVLQELGEAAWGGGGLGSSIIAGWTGDGSDGAADLDGTNTYSWASKSGSVYTLLRDVWLTSLTIRAGSTLKDVHTNGNTGFFRIYVQGTLDNAGTISFVGFPGVGASMQGGAAETGLNSTLRGGAAGANGRLNSTGNGTNATATTDVGGGAGGAGGGAGANTGGNPSGTFAINNGSIRTLPWVTQGWFSGSPTANNPARVTGGGGGGSGATAGAVTTNSGAGGGGGGVIVICAATITNSGTITVQGGDGAPAGTGVSGGSTSAAGGGGGGGGGLLFLTYHTLNNSGTLNVSGGNGGGGVTTGSNGSPGVDGEVIETQL